MDLSKRLGLITFVLIKPLSLLILISAFMSRVCSENVVVFLVLYVDNILLIENNVGVLYSLKVWLSG